MTPLALPFLNASTVCHLSVCVNLSISVDLSVCLWPHIWILFSYLDPVPGWA